MTGRFDHFDARPGGSSTTFDLVLKNNPTFIANTAKHYLFIQEIGDQVANYLARGRAGFHELLTDFVTGKGTLEQKDWAWEELFAFVKTATQTPVRNRLLSTYWTMAAVRHGDYVAKVRVAPAAGSALRRDHGCATPRQHVSQGPSDPESPAEERAHQCG
jgi:hypothetical protein